MDALRQISSVSDYLDQFEQLLHGILLYNTHCEDTYFVTRFLGGFSEEIWSVISLHRPKDVQSTSALALLQEEELENCKKKASSRDYVRPTYRPPSQSEKFKTPNADKQLQAKSKSEKMTPKTNGNL